MCGIAGFTLTEAERRDGPAAVRPVLEAMARSLAHRGPDAEGFLVNDAIAFGHRRLSILDLSPAGAQPMTSPRGAVIVFNGEIYNHRELRREFPGHPWRSNSDTETILALYDRDGPAFVDKIIGMFAIAIHDPARGELHLWRDRIGEKPLYWRHDRSNRRLLFASELRALLRHPETRREIDRDALHDYFLFNYIPAPRTILLGTNKLMPGEHLVFDFKANTLRLERYWELPKPIKNEGHRLYLLRSDEGVELAESALLDAVRARLLSDVPVGCFLSGGIDSSLVTALMAKAAGGAIRTFTAAFEEKGYDESGPAAEVARRLGTEHHTLRFSAADCLKLAHDIGSHVDEPFADPAFLPGLALARLTKEHVSVVLSGDGGDELELGYDRYGWAQKVADRTWFIPKALRLAAASWLAKRPGTRPRTLAEGLRFKDRRHIYPYVFIGWNNAFANRLLRGRRSFDDHAICRLAEESPRRDPSEVGSYVDLRNYLPDDILTKTDRATMRYGLESRVPLLDPDVVDQRTRAHRFPHGKWSGDKHMFRAILARHLPADLFDRPKQGFAVPLRHWFTKELRPLLHDAISPDALRAHGLLDEGVVGEMLQRHDGAVWNYERQLWALLVFQLWHREHLAP